MVRVLEGGCDVEVLKASDESKGVDATHRKEEHEHRAVVKLLDSRTDEKDAKMLYNAEKEDIIYVEKEPHEIEDGQRWLKFACIWQNRHLYWHTI